MVSVIWLLLLLFLALPVHADGIRATRANAWVTSNGQLAISSRFQTDLPEQLQEALMQGVPLNFELNYQLVSPTWAAYRSRFNQFVGSGDKIVYKLSYHPLTNRYRVSIGSFSTEYATLANALRALGAVVNWRVLSSGTLSGSPSSAVEAKIRLNLSISDLPRPFQINAVTSKNWQLDSGWQSLSVSNSGNVVQ